MRGGAEHVRLSRRVIRGVWGRLPGHLILAGRRVRSRLGKRNVRAAYGDRLVPVGPGRTRLVPVGPGRTRLVPVDPGYTRLVPVVALRVSRLICGVLIRELTLFVPLRAASAKS